MRQTEQTAIVLRHAEYRDNDRLLTLFSPTKGRIECIARGCRRPKSPLLAASELFALGDFELYEKSGRNTLTSAVLTETFYPIRTDFERLSCGMYLLEVCDCVIQPGKEDQNLFMLLLHSLSRLAFTQQPWRPLLAGFLLHFSACEGFKPRLNHCVMCGKRLGEEGPFFFDLEEGGLCCGECHERKERAALPGEKKQVPLEPQQVRWMREKLQSGSATWVDSPESYAPFSLLRKYAEGRLGRRLRSGALLPEE